MNFLIKTPRAGHEIELEGAGLYTEDADYLNFWRFNSITFRFGSTVIRWQVDPIHAAVALPGGYTFGDALAKCDQVRRQADGTYLLDRRGWIDLRFRVGSPVSPEEQGVWVRLYLEFDKNNGLIFVASGGRSCAFYVSAGGWRQTTGTRPPWPKSTSEEWTLERGDTGRTPGRSNRLLQVGAASAGPVVTNLLALAPDVKSRAASDYSFSFALRAVGTAWEVCTRFRLSPSFSTPQVSGYATLLDFEGRASAPLRAHAPELSCRRNCKGGWLIEWRDLPGAQGSLEPDILTLQTLSRGLLGEHALGLATTRALNRMSFIPTWISSADPDKVVRLEFTAQADADGRMSDIKLSSIQTDLQQRRMRLHMGGALGIDGAAWELLVHVDEQLRDREEDAVLSWVISNGGGPQRLAAGSVQLEAGGLTTGSLELRRSGDGRNYMRAPLESNLQLEFSEASYSALSMDPELGFETLSAIVQRPRPWAIDLKPASDARRCTLQLIERSRQDQSRLLQLQFKTSGRNDWGSDVVLFDPAPFTAARVITKETLEAGEIVAEYIDDADQAPEWRFYSQLGELTVVLPPQAIGEEMIKGYVHGEDEGAGRPRFPITNNDGEPTSLLDFRLTPTAQLKLDVTDINTARAEAPWSLRRLLGRRLGAVGVSLQRADFELLYGMQATLEAPGLRIAELEGFVGRVPVSDELWLTFLRGSRKSDVEQAQKELYAARAARWMEGLWHRPSWWRVYADLTKREQLKLDGVEYRLRPSRQTAHPFRISEHASPDAAPAAEIANRSPLRGGVDWPFQSSNVYDELVRKPISSSGTIEGLAFGSLGGEGIQTAAFNNGKTQIITSTRQGRLDSLTLIRIGRIAMTWNRARHVIVYERTTRMSPRYKGDGRPPTDGKDRLEQQPPFGGVAALRKVREYVEITEPRRRYPDLGAERVVAGPLLQSVFATTVIPVKSTWGRDIKDGFVIALRGPIETGEDLQFPDPQVFLDLARAPAKGEGGVAHRIASTDKLVFFTSTRDTDGPDTDVWPAWPDVDYPIFSPPGPPPLPYGSSFHGRSRQPDATAIEPGMGPFTFSLAPSEEAVNLMHGRPVPGVEARVHNINLARGLGARSQVKQDANEQFADFAAAHGQLLDGLGELRAELRERVATGADLPFSSIGSLRRDVEVLLKRLSRAAQVDVGKVSGQASDWGALQLERNQRFVTGVTNGIRDFQAQLTQPLDRERESLETARGRATALAEAVGTQALRKIEEVGFVPRIALDSLNTLASDLGRRFGARLADLRGRLVQNLIDFERLYASDSDSAAEIDARLRESLAFLPGSLSNLLDVVGPAMDDAAGQWFSRLKKGTSATLFEELVPKIEPAIAAIADAVERWSDAIPPIDLVQPQFPELRSQAEELLSAALVEPVRTAIETFLAEKLGELGSWQTALTDAQEAIRAWKDNLATQLNDAANLDALEAALAAAATDLKTELDAGAAAITAQLTDALRALPFQDLQGSLDALGGFAAETTAAIAKITSSLDGTVGEVEAVLKEQAAIAEQYAKAGAQQMESWARSSIGPTIEVGRQAIGTALEAVRIYGEGPVTEGIQVTRERLGYYYGQAEDALKLTHASAMFNDLGQEVLNSLSARMPFDRIRDRLLPRLENFAVRDLFPDFCGIKLTYLLPDLDVPLDGDHEYDWLRVQHGFDKDRVAAWAKVLIDKQFDNDATLFDLGPVKLRLLKPRFSAISDIRIEKDGGRRQETSARLDADFELGLNGKPMVTLRKGSLSFDERGELDFAFDSEQLELAAELQFVSDALKALMPQVEGLTITPLMPAGIDATLTLPLPDIGTGAFTLTGITLSSRLGLLVGDGFEIRTGLWLSKPERPFGLAILFLGGGGWFGIEATYKPPSEFVTRVSIGLSAGAFIALNFGFASGSAGLLFTVGVDFYRSWQTGAGSTAISLGLLMWGEFSIMGIASASIRLVLRITYQDGGMKGVGQLSVSIKICWCYTLRVSRSVEKVFAKPSGSSSGTSSLRAAKIPVVAGPLVEAHGLLAEAAEESPPKAADELIAQDYADLDRPDPAAVDAYFDTLAI